MDIDEAVQVLRDAGNGFPTRSLIFRYMLAVDVLLRVHEREALEVARLREALETIARGEKPAHLSAPEESWFRRVARDALLHQAEGTHENT